LVLGAKQDYGEIQFNPSADEELKKGMTLIVMGDVEDIARPEKFSRSRFKTPSKA